jgi:hypothetical protein
VQLQEILENLPFEMALLADSEKLAKIEMVIKQAGTNL